MNTGKVKQKNTLRVSEKDLLRLLTENEHLKKQVTELQTRGTELLTENRDLKKKIEEMDLTNAILKSQLINNPWDNPQQVSYPSQDLYDPNIYYDQSNHL